MAIVGGGLVFGGSGWKVSGVFRVEAGDMVKGGHIRMTVGMGLGMAVAVAVGINNDVAISTT